MRRKPLTPEDFDLIFDVKRNVMKVYNLKDEDMSQKKRRDVSDCNCMAYLLIKQELRKRKKKITTTKLAEIFGMNTHTTIVNGLRKIESLLKYNKETKNKYLKSQILIINNNGQNL